MAGQYLRRSQDRFQRLVRGFERTLRGQLARARQGPHQYLKPRQTSKSHDLLVGTNVLNNHLVFLKEEHRAVHCHVQGRSGVGKSKLLESFLRYDMDRGHGLCLIDPHGDLYQDSLRYLVRKRISPDRVILIDPNDSAYAVGLNYLEYDPDRISVTAHVSSVMRGIAKVFGAEDQDQKPQLQRWERATLLPLAVAGLTLVEVFDFLRRNDPSLRQAILQQVQNHYLDIEWSEFEAARRQDQDAWATPVLNRAAKFVLGDNIRRIIGQVHSTIDFRQALDQGKIILCNLACDQLSPEEQKLLGVMLIDKVCQAAQSRIDLPQAKRRRFYFYIDEFPEVLSADIAQALHAYRKYGLSFVLANQEVAQLLGSSLATYSAVMANCQVKLLFSVSREDSEIMAKQLFTGRIRDDYIKRIIKHWSFWPHETTRIVRAKGFSTTDSHGYAEAESLSDLVSQASSEALNPGPGQPLTTLTTGSNRGTSRSSGSTTGSSSAESSSESEVPFYEQIPFQEVSSIEDHSIEAILEKYIAWIHEQAPRQAQFKVLGLKRPPIPIKTPEVEEVRVRDKDIEAFKQAVSTRCARPVAEVDQEIEERRQGLLNQGQRLLTQAEPESFQAKPIKLVSISAAKV